MAQPIGVNQVKLFMRAPVPLAFLIFVTTFAIVFPVVFHSTRYSPFYWLDATTKKQRLTTYLIENYFRKAQAQNVVQQFRYSNILGRISENDLPSSFSGQHSSTAKVAIGIVTVDRTVETTRSVDGSLDAFEPGYLTQVVARLLGLANETLYENPNLLRRLRPSFFLCNVNQLPRRHYEAMNVSVAMPMVAIHRPGAGLHLHAKEKEKRDYVFCLNQALSGDPDYVLLVEDDALAAHDFLPTLHHLILDRLPERERRGGGKLAFVKLYHPVHLLGYWNPEINRFVELAGIGLVFGSLLYFGLAYSGAIVSRHTLTFFLCMLYVVGLACGVGRANLLWIRELNPWLRGLVSAPTCCSPAVLFTAKGVEAVSSYLEDVECGKDLGKDVAMDDFIAISGWDSLYLEPNLFEHIGVYSTLHQHVIDPAKV